jgi:acyl CoA:acetate/3-ketoacid CoA transferase
VTAGFVGVGFAEELAIALIERFLKNGRPRNLTYTYYDGGGLDITFLGMAETDAKGNVNVSKFGPPFTGPGDSYTSARMPRRSALSERLPPGDSTLPWMTASCESELKAGK